MFSQLFLGALVVGAAFVRADPNPSEPGPGDIFNQGATCHIAWDPDTTGVWKVMNIELMSGSNLQMNHITTVATVDGTDATKVTFDYPCPVVTPNAPIYFYQFTTPASSAVYWTTRFTIADANGHAAAAANPTQPDGSAIPWGVGALTDPSLAKPAPARGTGNGTVASVSVPGSSASVSVAAVSSSTPPLSTTPILASVTPSASASSSKMVQVSSSSQPSSASQSPAATGGAANGAVTMDSSFLRVTVTLGLTCLAFAVAL